MPIVKYPGSGTVVSGQACILYFKEARHLRVFGDLPEAPGPRWQSEEVWHSACPTQRTCDRRGDCAANVRTGRMRENAEAMGHCSSHGRARAGDDGTGVGGLQGSDG